jgi:hypothetical protein
MLSHTTSRTHLEIKHLMYLTKGKAMKNAAFEWLRLLWSKSVKLAFASGIMVILYAGLLYAVNLFWMVYLETPVGQRFLTLRIADMGTIDALRSENFLLLSLQVILTVLMVCLVFGAVSQVFLLIRYFYEGRGLLYRLIVWGIPCVALTAVAVSRTYEIGLAASFLLGVAPAMFLFQSCLRFTQGLVPELSTIIGDIAALAQKRLTRERRSEPRYDMSLLLAYRGPGTSNEYSSTASQISNHGFCLRDPKDLASGDTIRFTLNLENDSILGEAVIKWTKDVPAADKKTALASRSGCRIVSMATHHRASLKSFLSRNSMEEG